jgi:hypothetical protein
MDMYPISYPENFTSGDELQGSPEEPVIFRFDQDLVYSEELVESIEMPPESATHRGGSPLSNGSSWATSPSTPESFFYDTAMTRETSSHSQITDMARVYSTDGLFHIYPGFDGDNTGYGPSNHGDPFRPQVEEVMTKSPPKRKADGWLPICNAGPLAERRQSGGTSASPPVGPSQVRPQTAAYVRPKHPRVRCGDCNKEFRGDHEMSRHRQRVHGDVRRVWVVRDRSSNGLLAGCKTCVSEKWYGIDYNCTAHLRRQHFEKNNLPVPENLRDWIESFWVKKDNEGVEQIVDDSLTTVDEGSERNAKKCKSERTAYFERGTSEYLMGDPTSPTPSTDNIAPSTSSSFTEQYARLAQC